MTAGCNDSGGFLLAAHEAHQDQLGPYRCVEDVLHFPLLGSEVQHDGELDAEVAARLCAAGAAWARFKPTCFSGRNLSARRKY